MKTDKFGDTIRRKLEGISPEFEESDWVGMQNYMRAHAPSTFWQRYGNWIGYAAAASVTSLMAFGYVHQLNKNSELVSDVKNLKTQIEDVRRIANTAPSRDTVYIVQKEFVNQPTYLLNPDRESNLAEAQGKLAEVSAPDEQLEISAHENVNLPQSTQHLASSGSGNSAISGARPRRETEMGAENASMPQNDLTQNNNTLASAQNQSQATSPRETGIAPDDAQSGKTILLEPLEPIVSEKSRVSYNMNYALHNRIAPRQVRRALHIPDSRITSQAQIAKNTNKAESVKPSTSPTQTENVIPRLPIKAPYRFGAGMQFEKNIQATSVVGEVLVGKRFSISTGLSWLRVKTMKFKDEWVFREKNKEDFKREHPEQVPQLVKVYNINVEPTSLQIPLTVAFRNSIADKVDYYVSAGTNITIKSNEKYSFDCLPIGPGPAIGFFNKSFERQKDISPINSVNLSVGLEKSWHPIVLQAEGYLYTYFTPLSPMNSKSGPGFRIKLLYQIGKKY